MNHYNSNFNFPRLQLFLFPILLLHFIPHALHSPQWIWTTMFAITKENRKAPLSAAETISAWIAIDPVIFFRIHPSRFILEKAITSQKSYHLVSLWKCIATRATTHTANIKASSGISLRLKGRNISPNDKTKSTAKSHYRFLAEIGFFLIIFCSKGNWSPCCSHLHNETNQTKIALSYGHYSPTTRIMDHHVSAISNVLCVEHLFQMEIAKPKSKESVMSLM